MDLQKLIPQGSTGKPAKSGGMCLICDQEKPKSQMLVRALYWDYDAEEERGYKVCVCCSPYVGDPVVERHSLDIDDWDWRWLNHLDDDVQTFNGKTVSVQRW
jgi:hypothetical protein